MYRKNAWKKYGKDVKPVMDFAEDYKKFLTASKTERLVVKESVALLEKNGFVNGDTVKGLKEGDKVYFVNKNKNVVAFLLGKKPITEGLRICGAHIDSPRLDLKERPFYEKNEIAYADTHYYGGIKKYQWATIPLALHGVVCKKDGTTIQVNIGEKDDEGVITNFDKSGMSDALNWKGGGEFIYCELTKYNENAINAINNANSTNELIEIWDTLCSKYFLNYDVDIYKFNNH